MTTEGEAPWRPFHPAAVAFNALRALGGLAVLLVVVMLQGGSLLATLGWGVAGAAVALVAGVVRWRTNRWRVTDRAIEHREGWLSLSERSVPLARVQSVDAVQGPLQRAFGVLTVDVQTAGGGKEGEVTLPAVAPADVALLRRAAGVEVGDERELPGRRLGAGALLVAGLTAGSASVLVATGAAAAHFGQELFGDDGRRGLEDAARLLPDTAGGWVLAVALLLLAAWALGVLGTVLAFAGFTVRRDGDRLRITRGLLARRETSVAVGRVRAVRVVEGVLRQPFGLAAVRVDVLGADGEPPAAQTLFPLLRREEVGELLAVLLPERGGAGAVAPGQAPAADVLAVRPVPRRAAHRYAVPPAVLGGVAGGLLWALAPGIGPWPLLLALPGALWGLARWWAAGWRVGEAGCALRFRRLARTTVLFAPGRVQWCTVGATPLQRRARLAGVTVALGRRARASVRHLDAPVAWSLWHLTRGGP